MSTSGKIPLITPSASPPTSRKGKPMMTRSKSTSSSPTKRQRLSSSRTPSVVNTREGTNVDDVHQQRGESTMRLLNIWAHLPEKYARPIEEDDIVDLITGKVVKDRGVLRNLDSRWDFGRFADDVQDKAGNQTPVPGSVEAVADVEEPPTNHDEDEGSDDELDSFAHLHRPSGKRGDPVVKDKERDESESVAQDEDDDAEDIAPFIAPSKWVDALNPHDPKDAADLKEFLEAERQRRELYGSEGENVESDEQSDMGDASSVDNEIHTDATRQDGSDRDEEESIARPSPADLRESVDELAIQAETFSHKQYSSPSKVSPSPSTHPLTALLVKNWDATSSEATSRPKHKERVTIPKEVVKQNKASKARQLQTPPRSITSGPSPFSHRGSDLENYYDYTVPVSDPPSSNLLSIPSSPPSSPLPPSSPPPSSPPLFPSSPHSDYQLSTPSRSRTTSTHRQPESPFSSSPPSSPIKQGCPQFSTSRSESSKAVVKSAQTDRKGKTREVPIVLIQKPPPVMTSRRADKSEEQGREKQASFSSFPRVDLTQVTVKTPRKQSNATPLKAKPSVPRNETPSKLKVNREKALEPAPTPPIPSRIRPERQSRALGGSSRPSKGVSDTVGGVVKGTRSSSRSTPRASEVSTWVEPEEPEARSVQTGKWKGKGKEVVDSSSPPRRTTDINRNEKKRKRRGSSLTSGNEEILDDPSELQYGSSGGSSTLRVSSGSSSRLKEQSEDPHANGRRDRSSSMRPPKQRIRVEHRLSSGEDEEDSKPERRVDNKRRAQSYFDRTGYYPPPPHYYGHDTHLPSPSPLYDPRAQSILSNALHQLSALFSGGPVSSWPPPPPPPSATYVGEDGHSSSDEENNKARIRSQSQNPSSSGQRSHSRSRSQSKPRPPQNQHPPAFYPPVSRRAQSHRPSSYFDSPQSTPGRQHYRDRRWEQQQYASTSSTSTPTHRAHPYPHSYDPDWSKGTLPPSSSSPESEEDDENEGGVHHDRRSSPEPLPSLKSRSRQGRSSSHPVQKSDRGKGDHDGSSSSSPTPVPAPPPPPEPRSSSLVRRGRARGRRVSFGSVEHIDVTVESEVVEAYEDDEYRYRKDERTRREGGGEQEEEEEEEEEGGEKAVDPLVLGNPTSRDRRRRRLYRHATPALIRSSSSSRQETERGEEGGVVDEEERGSRSRPSSHHTLEAPLPPVRGSKQRNKSKEPTMVNANTTTTKSTTSSSSKSIVVPTLARTNDVIELTDSSDSEREKDTYVRGRQKVRARTVR